MKTDGIAYRIAAALLAVVGLAAFFFLIGDEVPEHPLTFWEFALVKGVSLAVLAVVLYAAQALMNRREEEK